MRRLTKKQKRVLASLKKAQDKMAIRFWLGVVAAIIGSSLSLEFRHPITGALVFFARVLVSLTMFGGLVLAWESWKQGRFYSNAIEDLEFGLYAGGPNTIISAFLHELKKTGEASIAVPKRKIYVEANKYRTGPGGPPLISLRYIRRGKTKTFLVLPYGDFEKWMTSPTPEARAFRGNSSVTWEKLVYFLENYRRVKARLAKKKRK